MSVHGEFRCHDIGEQIVADCHRGSAWLRVPLSNDGQLAAIAFLTDADCLRLAGDLHRIGHRLREQREEREGVTA